MSQTLKTINTLAKIGKIISKVLFVLCIIGSVACLAVIPLLFAVWELDVNGEALGIIIKQESGYSMNMLYFACTIGAIACAAQSVVCRFAELYFANQLAAGTPFTNECAKEIRRLGILSITIPLGAAILNEIVYHIFAIFGSMEKQFAADYSISVDLGIAFIVASVIFKYGAELREKAERVDN